MGLHWWSIAKKITDIGALVLGAAATGLDAFGVPEAGVLVGEASAGLEVISAGLGPSSMSEVRSARSPSPTTRL